MKRFLTLLGVVFFIEIASAQDVLITKDGDAIKVWGIEVSNTAVFYRESDAQNASIKRVDKKDVLMIKYQDGRKFIIGEDNVQPSLNVTQTNDVTATPTSDVADPQANKEVLNSIKSQKVEFAGSPSNSEASMLFCQYLPKSNAIIADKNMSFSVVTEAKSYFNGSKSQPLAGDIILFVIVKNRTKKTMYVDLGNTFLVRGGQSFAYYVPTMTSHSSGTSTGVGIGVGTVVGNLAGGIGLGSTSSESVTTTTMAQRIIAVPPMSEKKIESPTTLFPIENKDLYNEDIKYTGLYKDLSLCLDKSEMLKVSECRDLNENFNVGAFSVVVSYADDETISQPHMLNADFSIQHIVGTKSGHKIDMKYFNIDYVSKNYKNTAYFFAKQLRKK